MPRANRYSLPGHVWHLTHRCHDGKFLLRFAVDRRTWVRWLFTARKRFGLCVLNYQVTSNHVHLVVRDRGRGEIAASMQLLEGCTGAAYNRRRRRLGGFWRDRYNATAVESGEHLWRCLAYVDMNMVRAGVVSHPSKWPHAGYHEIVRPRQRYRIVDREALSEALGIGCIAQLSSRYEEAVEEALARGSTREECWTQSIAVGSREYVERVAAKLGSRALYRSVSAAGDGRFVLRERCPPYVAFLGAEITA